MTKARIAGACIVDCQPHAALQIPSQAIPEGFVVLHCLLLGELDDESIRKFGAEVKERGFSDRGRTGVDKQHPSIWRGTELDCSGKAGQLKSLAQAELRRLVKPPIRRMPRVDGHPGKRLIPDHDHVSGANNGLDHRGDHTWLAEVLDCAPQVNLHFRARSLGVGDGHLFPIGNDLRILERPDWKAA